MQERNELIVTLTETAATLTFTNPPPIQKFAKTEEFGITKIQAETHANVPRQNFIRELSSTDDKNPVKRNEHYSVFNSAVGSMLHYAYREHRAVILSPDDIQLLLVQGFSRFLQLYAEDFRSRLVSFSGKKDLLVRNDFLTDIDPESWEVVPAGFAKLIRHEIPTAIVDLLLQDFSVTTKIERQVKAVTLMGTFSSYFNYSVATLCFIPEFILKGTQEDWQKIAAFPEQLIKLLNLQPCTTNERENGTHLLHRWLTRLQPLVNEFYQARCGHANAAMWKEFYKKEDDSGFSHVSGNFVHFYPFLTKLVGEQLVPGEFVLNKWTMGKEVTLDHGRNAPHTSELPANVVEVDFNWNDLGDVYNMGMKAGIFGFNIDEKRNRTTSTYTDYTIFFKSRKPVATNDFSPFIVADTHSTVVDPSFDMSNVKEIITDIETDSVSRSLPAASVPVAIPEDKLQDFISMRDAIKAKQAEVRELREAMAKKNKGVASQQGKFAPSAMDVSKGEPSNVTKNTL